MKKVFIIILKVFLILLILLIILRIIGIGFSIWFWNDIVHLLHNAGVNLYLAKFFAIPLAFLISYIIVKLFSVRKNKRKKAFLLIAAIFSIYFIAMYFYVKTPIQRIEPTMESRFFSPSGEPLIWYYEYSNGKLEFFNHSGIHPQYGTSLMPISKEIAEKVLNYISKGRNDMIISNDSYQPDNIFEELKEELKRVKN